MGVKRVSRTTLRARMKGVRKQTEENIWKFKTGQETGRWQKFHSDRLHNLYVAELLELWNEIEGMDGVRRTHG
jgi:hypothetical protein